MSLKRGQRIQIGGVRYRVVFVNVSRAYCVPLEKRRVRIGDRSFEARERGISISPHSDDMEAGR